MYRSVVCALSLVCCVSGNASEDPCQEIVNATLAEVRAGADTAMSDDDAALVRLAAGSACVKAMSGRYAEVAAAPEVVSETVTKDEPRPEAASDEEDDGSFEAGGITFRPLSGSPSKKPYERNRGSDD
ncbi:hypothetical protein NOR51B_559 [Luminiphilus syltensis NOR5-1B]|uniref:Secreted protein n=1 Tax=Luminiphilus syltensis NOR5-1B TaxID=565045 RepID=B8KS36_9GAMM|nr:hypothetical protein [Luminiphilus syltensis]EED34621.1 hypothetical protein NOR51B_559 [Luminiphilus syltensis NOR5-1B]